MMENESAHFAHKYEQTHEAELSEERRRFLAEKAIRQTEQEYLKRSTLGTGKAGEVWKSDDPDYENFKCVKVNLHPEASVNTLEKEFDLQQEFFEAGVSVPEPMMYVHSRDESRASKHGVIIMEEIPGMTLEQLILDLEAAGEQLAPEVIKRIDDCINIQIEQAHAKGLYHRDLHLRNFMITPDLLTSDAGRGFMIDFGDAVKVVGGPDDNEIYSQEAFRGGKMVMVKFPKDEDLRKTFKRELLRRKLVAISA